LFRTGFGFAQDKLREGSHPSIIRFFASLIYEKGSVVKVVWVAVSVPLSRTLLADLIGLIA